jgi:hypothetical protein
MISQYIRDSKGRKRGVLVGVRVLENCFAIGWALYCKNAESEPFSRSRGINIALGRTQVKKARPTIWFEIEYPPCTPGSLLRKTEALRELMYQANAPQSIKKDLNLFLVRCTKYFKNSGENAATKKAPAHDYEGAEEAGLTVSASKERAKVIREKPAKTKSKAKHNA